MKTVNVPTWEETKAWVATLGPLTTIDLVDVDACVGTQLMQWANPDAVKIRHIWVNGIVWTPRLMGLEAYEFEPASPLYRLMKRLQNRAEDVTHRYVSRFALEALIHEVEESQRIRRRLDIARAGDVVAARAERPVTRELETIT